MALRPADIPSGFAASARLVHVDDVDPDAAIAAGKAGIAAGVHVTSDIEAARPKTPAILDAVTIPIFGEFVPGDLTGERDLERGLRILRHRHAGMLVVTLGARGAAALHGDRFIRQPAFPVDVIDTTGAGDVFRAGFEVEDFDAQVAGVAEARSADLSCRPLHAGGAVFICHF